MTVLERTILVLKSFMLGIGVMFALEVKTKNMAMVGFFIELLILVLNVLGI